MAKSYNGWPAPPARRVDLTVGRVSFVGGVAPGDVHTVLGYVAEQYNARVEKLVNPGCWGYAYRDNRNADNLSCHASGTAIDCNAPAHPNGIEASRNYSPTQIRAVHAILASVPELADVVHWGGDWHAPLRPDPMHFEIHDRDTAKLARVAARIRKIGTAPKPPQEDDVTPDDIAKIAQAVLDAKIDNRDPGKGVVGQISLGEMVTKVERDRNANGERFRSIEAALRAILAKMDTAPK